MARKKGEISQSGVKQKIIIYILKKNGPLEESKIRESLKREDKKINQGNINRHLHELEDLKCIKLTQTKKGRREYNLWDITSIQNLESIRSQLHEIQLNKYEKSLAILLHKFGIDQKSSRYVYFFILLLSSPSFFNACMNTDVKTLHSRAREIFNHGKGFKEEKRIEELLNDCNAKHIKGKLNVELPKERFREMMEELAQKNDEILEEYAWRVCGCYSEQARERKKSKLTGDNSVIQAIKRNRSQNPSLFPLEPIPWIESFYMKFRENIPELSKIEIKTILKTPDEYQNMCLEMEEILSLMRDQNKTFNRSYLDLLFEHFYYQDILDGTASTDEITFAQNSKKIIEEYEKSGDDVDIIDKLDKLILNEMRNISWVISKHKMPSILQNISDNPEVVLHNLLNLYGYQSILEKLEKSPS
ncbi:hypothetical protein [Methanosarcina mazei]|uniref:Uncharacterized protein n=1 Tax=Methanosarcina mazei TaxID=2209 RepID=A0A4P8R2I5_METMZ|nr:hypothetical protein [Methanosarcina mazei]QCR16560.1 hypothetical protein DKM28_11575 [Methanosarcina mazei]